MTSGPPVTPQELVQESRGHEVFSEELAQFGGGVAGQDLQSGSYRIGLTPIADWFLLTVWELDEPDS